MRRGRAAFDNREMTFGRTMLQHWTLDPACTYLNHGTVGAVPRRVQQRQQELRDEMILGMKDEEVTARLSESTPPVRVAD